MVISPRFHRGPRRTRTMSSTLRQFTRCRKEADSVPGVMGERFRYARGHPPAFWLGAGGTATRAKQRLSGSTRFEEFVALKKLLA